MCLNIQGLHDFERLGDIFKYAKQIQNKIFADSHLPTQFLVLNPPSVLENITLSTKITQPLDLEWKKSTESE